MYQITKLWLGVLNVQFLHHEVRLVKMWIHRWWDDIKMYLQAVGWGALTGLIWLMIGTGQRFL